MGCVDGAVLSSCRTGIGVVIRNNKGDFVAAMGVNLHHWDSTTVELQAMLAVKQVS